ncbi:hypothetical protein [Pseudonocardia xinjiangensis]|uniref:Uncharacterized protein n=1 Tax=Pseudonocardia xinjiangensis TaxID=75289 RepID=A0ABX1RB16_9PSEU|nr:hypothetical protein [Pseudonocardia xinjiangensis]NMH76403.1 hypothetical protein [Pseudonocardia xinjiangensis]
MASGDGSYIFPEEHNNFLADYKELLQRYPEAAARFALADLGDRAAVPVSGPGAPVSIIECTPHVGGKVDCQEVHLQ